MVFNTEQQNMYMRRVIFLPATQQWVGYSVSTRRLKRSLTLQQGVPALFKWHCFYFPGELRNADDSPRHVTLHSFETVKKTKHTFAHINNSSHSFMLKKIVETVEFVFFHFFF